MKTCLKIGIVFFVSIIVPACLSSYYLNTTDIEVLMPAKVVFPAGYDKIAARYNNANVAYNPHFAEYIVNHKIVMDTTNTDSVASKLYFNGFLQRMNSTPLFAPVIEIEPESYSNVLLSDSLVRLKYPAINDSTPFGTPASVEQLSRLVTKFQLNTGSRTSLKYIDPEFGLYSRKNIADIADSTNANMLLSLDYFAVIDARQDTIPMAKWQIVYVITSWNFYDLNNSLLPFFYTRVDTLSYQHSFDGIPFPEREEVVLLASEISGSNFADFLAPNWTNVERIYYRPWNRYLKPTLKLIKEGKGLKAAEYWRPYTNDENPKIAARSMYNMALASELENQLDAAIDWAVRSYHLLEKKDEVHKQICEQYIQVLTQRKLDFKQIDVQFTREASNTK